MNTTIVFTWKYKIKSTSGNEPDVRIPDGFDCDHKDQCEVCKKSPMASSYDWKKCVHPKIKDKY